MGSEGRNVSRPVEFSAARPLLADKAGRAKSPLQAPSPASAPHTRSQQPRALSPPIAAAALCLPPWKSRCPGGPPRTAEIRGLGAKPKPKRTPDSLPEAREAPPRGSGPDQGWRCGERKRRGCHRRGPFVTATLPSPASTPNPWLTKVCQVRPPSLPNPSGSAPSPARLASPRAPARPPSPRSPQHPRARPPAAPTAAR